MRIRFLGVGEAFDENHPNTSIFIDDIGLLIDCGYSSVSSIWKSGIQKKIDTIYISHFHGDHTFGLPALLLRYFEEKRSEPLTIIGAKGVEKYIRDMTALAYSTHMDRLSFDIIYLDIDRDTKITLNNAKLSFAKAEHKESSYAIRIDHEKKSILYSGDTGYSKEIVDLAKDIDLLVHEAYTYQKEKENNGLVNHSSFLSVGLSASNSGCKKLALVHISRSSRNIALIKEEIKKVYSGPLIIPQDGDEVRI